VRDRPSFFRGRCSWRSSRRIKVSHRFVNALALLTLACAVACLAQNSLPTAGPKPRDVPAAWKQLIGEYSQEGGKDKLTVFENSGGLQLTRSSGAHIELQLVGSGTLRYHHDLDNTEHVAPIHRDANGKVTGIALDSTEYKRQDLPSGERATLLVKPQRAVPELRQEALAAQPPVETGNFRKPELVELTKLDPQIHLDIRYATSNDFLGTPVYTQARAFLQQPAAEALVRVEHKLEPLGYGLLIHDGYRPWYVTKIFWDATPAEGKIFVADPSQGSRHNRGCAVDLTLYDRATGKAIEMPGTYDEMSPRSYPSYVGGTSLQRWHRDLLRRAMESEGFTVYEYEWWHFDYKDWHEYPILNIPFEQLGAGAAASKN
jgi:D-alanyl-D-alanine dipeptidase